MNRAVDFILDIMEAETARKIIRVICAACAVIICVWAVSFIYGRATAGSELRGWREASAVVRESEITGEKLEQASRPLSSFESVGANAAGREYYKVYKVSYSFAAETNAWGAVFAFRDSGANTGEVSEWEVEPPPYAYIIPKAGDRVAIIYDPANYGSYKLGSMSDWREENGVSLPDFYVPVIFFVIGIVLLTLDAQIKRRDE